MIKTVNELCSEYGDIRFQRANALVGEDATKGSFSIIVNGSKKYAMGERKKGKKGNVSRESEKVQKILDDFLERTQIHVLCTEHARALLRDGDLFLNVIVDKKSGLITEVKRAPALTMKKNVNEYGNFIDIRKAFSHKYIKWQLKMHQKEAERILHYIKSIILNGFLMKQKFMAQVNMQWQ